ncbi:MAG: nucleotidyl transferase AbiEii/AbiGii toxin family protein [Polaribacter sp.]
MGTVKIDCITHKYPLVEKIKVENGIRLYSMKDILAMKLSAIIDNGTRLKDFIDIACLSTELTLSVALSSYKHKYKNSNPIVPIQALVYYNDICFNEPIQMLKGNYKWEKIEKRIKNMINKKHQKFSEIPIDCIEPQNKGLSL